MYQIVSNSPSRGLHEVTDMKIQLPVIAKQPTLKDDKSATLKFISLFELTNEAVAFIRDNANQKGWLIFSPNELQESDIPQGQAPSGEFKTASQRLRAVMFVWWKQLNSQDKFQDFYESELNRIIESYKAKLD